MSVDNNWKYVWYNETLPHSSETKIFMLDEKTLLYIFMGIVQLKDLSNLEAFYQIISSKHEYHISEEWSCI